MNYTVMYTLTLLKKHKHWLIKKRARSVVMIEGIPPAIYKLCGLEAMQLIKKKKG
ncbi:hypothetical protein J7E95_17525 [Streptomyces sp. ISL-14]|nr:hypothetical protein [Streptomyces sp. ISL-14]